MIPSLSGPLMTTFSIVAVDPDSGETGAAVASKFLAVGSLVPVVKTGIGGIAVQAKTNRTLANVILSELEVGSDPGSIIDRVQRSDPQIEYRQFGFIDRYGNGAGFTGKECLPSAGHIAGQNFCCQGNCLKGPEVMKSMAAAFMETQGDIAERLLSAVMAGQRCGGDKRGKQSAALVVKSPAKDLLGSTDCLVDLRVDDHAHPEIELQRLLQLQRVAYSKNFTDRSFPFKGETVKALLSLSSDKNLSIETRQGLKDFRQYLEREVRKIKSDIKTIFDGENISGKAVDLLVAKAVADEENRLKCEP